MTLTLSTKVDGRQIDLFWQRFRSLLHKHGYRPQYFKVKEFTEKGQRHLHVLIDIFVPFNEIQYAWRLATEGTSFWVHIKKTQVRRAAGYMSKYLTKQTVLSSSFDKGEHRYSFSRKFPRMPKEEQEKEQGRYTYISAVALMRELVDKCEWYEGDMKTYKKIAEDLAKKAKLKRDEIKYGVRSKTPRRHHYQLKEAALPLRRVD
jgi:hypothetical protein